MSHDPTRTRPSTWRAGFDALVRDRMATPFAWGSHDCCMWAADAVMAQKGIDPAAAERGSYADALGAARLLESLGGLATIGARAGGSIPPLCAMAGDIGLVRCDDREHLAVCVGHAWLAPAKTGLAALPLTAATVAWRVQRG